MPKLKQSSSDKIKKYISRVTVSDDREKETEQQKEVSVSQRAEDTSVRTGAPVRKQSSMEVVKRYESGTGTTRVNRETPETSRNETENKKQQEAEYNRLSTMNLDESRKALDALKDQIKAADRERRQSIVSMSAWDYLPDDQMERLQADLDEKELRYNELSRQAKEKQKEIMNAERVQQGVKYSALKGNDDFAKYSAQGAAIKNPTVKDASGVVNLFGWRPGAEDVGNIVTYSRDNWEDIRKAENSAAVRTLSGGFDLSGGDVIGKSLYHYMTDDEVATYNYLLAKEGAESAQKFLDWLEETLNYRYGTEMGEYVSGIENGIGRAAATGLYGIGAGLDQFTGGIKQMVSSDRLPTSAVQFGSQNIRENLKDAGPKIFGSSLGQAAYDVVTTGANMAPSILVSALTGGLGAPAAAAGAIGSATLGASASGNAYGQALNEGYGKSEARAYSVMVGASEAGLQYLLGGIGKLGGVADDVLLAKVGAIDSALKRVALTGAVKIGSEVSEEVLQDILEPAFRTVIFSEEYDAPTLEELAYTAIVTALSTGILDSGEIASAGSRKTANMGAEFKSMGNDTVKAIIDEGISADPKSESYKLAKKLQMDLEAGKSISDQKLGQMYLDNVENVDYTSDPDKILADAAAETVEREMAENGSETEQEAANPSGRKLLTETDGGAGNAARAVNERDSVSSVPYNVLNTDNETLRKAMEAGYGTKGNQSFNDILADSGMSQSELKSRFQSAYDAGFANVPRDRITLLDDIQEAAYIAGRQDNILSMKKAEDRAELNDRPNTVAGNADGASRASEIRNTDLNNNLEGATERYGQTEVYLRNGSQRDGGTDPGGQVSAMEGGTGQDSLREVRGKPADGEASRLSYGKAVSTASLGIVGGSTKANIRIVTGSDTTSTRAAKQLAKERGLRLTLFAGDNLNIRQNDGSYASVRGMYVTGDRVFVRADHPVYTADQLMRHEAGHDMIGKGEVDAAAVRERLAERYGEDYAQSTAQMYEQAYRGSGLTADEVWEECICDSLGDMNVFSGTESAKTAEEFLPRVKQAAQEVRGESEQTRGPPDGAETDVGDKTSRELDVSRLTDYNAMIDRPDMRLTEINDSVRYEANKQTRKQLVQQALKNAASIGKTNESGGVSVFVDDIGRDVLLSTHSLRHGLDRRFSMLAPITEKAGEILKNSVLINILTPQSQSASDSYVLIGAAKNQRNDPYIVRFVVNQHSNEVATVDVLYAINAKKEPAALLPAITGKSATLTDSNISIANLLDFASVYFPDALPESVLRHYGFEARPEGKIGESALYSRELENVELLREQNEALREKAEYWKGQTKRTTAENRTVRKADIEALAGRIIRAYDSKLTTKDISGQLSELGNYIVRGGDGKNDLTWQELKDRAVVIAKDVIESAEQLNDEMYQQYKDLRDYLRKTDIVYGREYHGDIPDFEDFRKKNFGRLNLKSAGRTNIDSVYEEMSEMWPEFFNSQEQSHPTDQLLHIVDVLDGLRPIYENPFSYDMATAVEYAANDIIDGLLSDNVRQSPPTFADRQAGKLDKEKTLRKEQVQQARDEGRERLARQKAADAEKLDRAVLGEKMAAGREMAEYQRKAREAIAFERQRRNERVQQLKDHYAEVRQNQAARRADSKARSRLLKIAKRLQNKKLPAVNRALLDQYIGDLDTAAKGITGKTLEKLSDLQEWYNDRKGNDPDFIADPGIEQALSRLSKRHIADMTADEVAELTDVLLNIENELRTERQLIDDADRRDTYHLGMETIENIENTRGSRVNGIGGALDKFIVTETLSPVRQVRRMTGYVDSDPLYRLVNGLADGQRAMLDYQRKAERPFERFAADKAFSGSFSGQKAERVQISGLGRDGAKTVTITPAMRVSLYLHSLNDQNMRHINDGGITVPDEKLYRKGKLSEAYARGTTIKLTPSQVRSITAGMTEKERSFAMAAQRYFNETSKTAINETSEKLKGYSLAQVDNYFPINTDTSFTRSEFESLKRDGTIEGMGFLKERVRASNPILLRDANAVLEQAIQMHGKYVGLAIPVRNFNKVWNVTTVKENDDGSLTHFDGSLQQAVKNRWGDAGYGYVEKMMTDLQGGTPQKNVWVKALNKVRSNYAGAVLTLNLSVAMKQAASYPTAAAVLGWKPLARAMADVGKVDLATIEKYTPLQWYRSKGFSTRELGDLKSADRQLPTVLNWVQGVDLLTTRKLWKASEYYVRQNNRALNVGTEAYYRAVADIYNRVIEETQPNYTTMQRPQLLRSDDSLMGNLAMFKTQPFQNFNILYDAVGNFAAKAERAKTGGAKEKADAKKAMTGLGRAVTSQLAQLAVFAGMTMVWALLRGRPDKYEDKDGDMTAASILTALGKDIAGGAFSSVPFGSDAWELLCSKVFNDKYYGVDAVTVTAITDTLQALSDLSEQIGRIVKNAASGVETNWNSERLKLDRELDSISKAVGVPYENVANLFNMAFQRTAVAANGKYLGGYSYLKLTTDPEKYPSDYYDILYKAMQNSREEYETIYSDMVQNGSFTEKSISDAIEKRMKKAEGVTKVDELDRRYLSPNEEKSWDRLYSKIQGSRTWAAATQDQRSVIEDDLYDLVTGSAAGVKLQEKISAGSAYGIDEAEYLLYKLALDVYDRPTKSGTYGTYTQDEAEEAIKSLDNLTDEQRSYLWQSVNKNWNEKNNPWG